MRIKSERERENERTRESETESNEGEGGRSYPGVVSFWNDLILILKLVH